MVCGATTLAASLCSRHKLVVASKKAKNIGHGAGGGGFSFGLLRRLMLGAEGAFFDGAAVEGDPDAIVRRRGGGTGGASRLTGRSARGDDAGEWAAT